MRYLITGGLGVIGSLYAKWVESVHDQVVVVDDGADKRHDWMAQRLAESGITVVRQCMTDQVLTDYFGGVAPDRILHAAASTGIPYSGTAPLDDWERNVDCTIWLLEELRRYHVPTVVLSSVKPYYVEHTPNGIGEFWPLSPDEPYAASKAAQSCACQAWGTSYDLPLVCFRCSNLYGPAPCHGPRHGWLTWFCIQAALGLTIEVQGTGQQSRDMLWYTDLFDAIRRGFEAVEEETIDPGTLMNIGGGTNFTITVNKAVTELQRYTEVTTKQGPGRKFEDDWFATDIGLAQDLLKWNPQVDPRQGIKQLYEWAVENKDELAEVYG